MTMMPKMKKKLKDPNAKGPLDKFAPIFAAVAFAWVLVDIVGFGFSVITKAPEREQKELQRYIDDAVDKSLMMRFPQTSGPVLRTQKENKQWVDFINKDKKNGN